MTTNMSKLLDNGCLWQKKLNFHFLNSLFSYFGGAKIASWTSDPSLIPKGGRCPPGSAYMWARNTVTPTESKRGYFDTSVPVCSKMLCDFAKNFRIAINIFCEGQGTPHELILTSIKCTLASQWRDDCQYTIPVHCVSLCVGTVLALMQ